MLTLAAAFLTRPRARISGSGMRSLPIRKFSSERCVCAPQYARPERRSRRMNPFRYALAPGLSRPCRPPRMRGEKRAARRRLANLSLELEQFYNHQKSLTFLLKPHRAAVAMSLMRRGLKVRSVIAFSALCAGLAFGGSASAAAEFYIGEPMVKEGMQLVPNYLEGIQMDHHPARHVDGPQGDPFRDRRACNEGREARLRRGRLDPLSHHHDDRREDRRRNTRNSKKLAPMTARRRPPLRQQLQDGRPGPVQGHLCDRAALEASASSVMSIRRRACRIGGSRSPRPGLSTIRASRNRNEQVQMSKSK